MTSHVKEKLTFSAIVPAYNEEKYISRCLESIFSLEDATGLREVIVVNNASTDETAEIVKGSFPEVKLINEPRKGLTIAYNHGASKAEGEILLFVDADMILPPDHLRKLSREFDRDPELVALSGPYVYKDGGRIRELLIRLMYLLIVMPGELVFNRFLNLGANVASGNSAMRRGAFQKIQGFNEELFYGCEVDIASRIRSLGKVRFRHRLSAESSSRRLKKEGNLKVGLRHLLSTLWPLFFGKKFSKGCIDVR